MDDLISRQAAITAIQEAYADTEGGDDKCAVWKNIGLTDALHIMQDLPSAQPERKKGKWNCSDDMYESGVCSVCEWDTGDSYANCKKWFKYCPNCGADMRGET